MDLDRLGQAPHLNARMRPADQVSVELHVDRSGRDLGQVQKGAVLVGAIPHQHCGGARHDGRLSQKTGRFERSRTAG
ncbi:hypothetical protein [Cryobacterium sp. M96]|uniref:hypothetical protein n=1 Tax=Cryobacterium sp. M96 TaxID=2048295 RepID=UPI000CE4A1F8|nr:hypothetical protein [Cryobacterium sp. M96]